MNYFLVDGLTIDEESRQLADEQVEANDDLSTMEELDKEAEGRWKILQFQSISKIFKEFLNFQSSQPNTISARKSAQTARSPLWWTKEW